MISPRAPIAYRTFAVALAMAAGVAMSIGCETAAKVPGLSQLGELSGLTNRDVQQIEKVLEEVHKAIETRRPARAMMYMSRSYHDAEGRDYDALEAYLVEAFREYRDIRIERVPPRIVIEGDKARAFETFGTVGEPRSPGVNPPLNIQGQVTVHFEKTGGQWLIVEWGCML